jgi:hypothetical protein
MSKSIRVRTQVGVDKQVNIDLQQDFEFLEILSLKLSQSDLYVRQCSDYGVVAGRVSVNDGFGIPNAKLSIFIPVTQEDENNPIISSIYPYKTFNDVNEDGYKYNLLPYKPSYPGHSATGSFPDLEDVLTNPTAIQIFDKYYKFTVTTNDSGDFMIFGVPTGSQTLIMNVDLSDIGPFSQSPQDLIRLGIATENQVNGTTFKTSENITTLPQIITINKEVVVNPLWGDDELCQVSITRTDFDLTAEANIEIKPTAIFMGSIFSDIDKAAVKKKCKPPLKNGQMCSLVSAPGQILSIRQTIRQDNTGKPVLEEYELENNGNVIDDNGAWLVDLPMNLDYITTNEFGEQVFSNDERKGIPTRAKYRFKVKWNQSPDLSAPVKRANFLVPNIREHGWSISENDPIITNNDNYQLLKSSYAFSLDWNDYGYSGLTNAGQEMIQDAIDCKDTFYDMSYNKVYTISQLITRYRNGNALRRYLGIKNITDEECDSTSNKFPTNDAQFKFDLLFILFVILSTFISILLKVVVVIFHVICAVAEFLINIKFLGIQPFKDSTALRRILERFSNLNIPMFTFPDCELCSCKATTSPVPSGAFTLQNANPFVNNSVLADVINQDLFLASQSEDEEFSQITQQTVGLYESNVLGTSYAFRTPRFYLFAISPDVRIYWTQNLTLAERVNLMSFKGKFFGAYSDTTDATLNGVNLDNTYPALVGNIDVGGGTNQIKVNFNSELNNDNTFHFDNTLILLTENQYGSGTLLSFQNVFNSSDINLSADTENVFGNFAITGTPTNLTQITVSSTDPVTGRRVLTNYNVNQTQDDSDKYLKFPTDTEYFQVLTSITYTQYMSIIEDDQFGCSSGNNGYQKSFRHRVFDSSTDVYRVSILPSVSSGIFTNLNAWSIFQNKNETYITIMVRGVDPHSTRQKVKYGLGRLFCRDNHWDVSLTGDFKLNIPLQPNDGLDFGESPTNQSQIDAVSKSQRCVKHDNITTNDLLDNSYSKGRVYFPSYHFSPGSQWTPYSHNKISHYSSLDETTGTFSPENPENYPLVSDNTVSSYTTTAGNNGLKISIDNRYAKEIQGINSNIIATVIPSLRRYGSHYIIGERVEGGSVIGMRDQINDVDGTLQSIYFSPKYSETTTINMVNSQKIVMRTDRMPTSELFQTFGNNNYQGMNNGQFLILEIGDDGSINSPDPGLNTPSFSTASPEDPETGQTATLINSFSCESLVPIECYSNSNDTVQILPDTQCQYYPGTSERFFVEGSCYSLVHPPYITNLKKDLQLVTEWLSRININFGACREVFSHVFINNWVNGTLYMFPFKNSRFFTGPTDNPPNQPYNKFCTDTVFLHPETFNFYYRSAPYSDNASQYIGRTGYRRQSNNELIGNRKNLMFPTTIMDLGPRDELQKFLSQSGNWDGYIVNKLEPTTFGDTSDILNLFILSRFANTSFGALFQQGEGVNVLKFFSRDKRMVDSDFAQMVATNSQFGISAYDPEDYPDPQDLATYNSPLYFPSGVATTGDITFGIFYTGNSQIRDYISPNITVYNPDGDVDNECSYSFIPLNSQEVPFYLWDIKDNTSNPNIFGTQENDWTFDGNNAFKYKYQGVNRLEPSSKNFQPDPGINQIKYHKGWIYNVDNGLVNPETNEFDYKPEPGIPKKYLMGAPFYFYFGLTKGASAFDRFASKWINTEELTE